MKLHGNAALSWHGRRRLALRVVREGWTMQAAAGAAGVGVRCARKWVGRYRLEGESGLHDRSSAPRRVAHRTAPERVAVVLALRRLRFTAAEIAETLGMASRRFLRCLSARAWGGSDGSASSSLSATNAHALVSSCTSTSSGSGGSRAAQANAPSGAPVASGTTQPGPIAMASVITTSAMSACTCASTTTAASVQLPGLLSSPREAAVRARDMLDGEVAEADLRDSQSQHHPPCGFNT